MNFTTELMPDFNLIYIRRTGAYGPENIELMETFKKWASKFDLLTDEAILLGIPHDDPSMTPADACRYDVGIISDSISQALDTSGQEVSLTSYPAGKYVVLTISHTMEALAHAWTHVFTRLMDNGYALDASRPAFERYRMLLVNNHLCEICVPIN